ncbi:Hsp20/alpha crystallin family protein [Pseudanabaena sp. PCC 6802]|uniref:Hsp20/alpha crystallin family protein n=1 Tax=Pseudanabaena sp. PCC 6802 TaxID=118173 RepID=UPI00034D3FEC|nr:Hsp20/alpha crystallin family protein [Pseudanabaena sp. PCC 6802]
MSLIRWEPFREIDSLQREMNRLFDTMLPTTGRELGTFIPPVELKETPEAFQLKLEVPGIEAKDLDIEVTADSISISGERKSETETEEKGYKRTEFRYGQFRRVIPLTAHVQNDKVEAEYKDGILNLSLPKAEPEKTKVVKVNVAS